MDFWMILWKYVFFISVTAFGIMSVWVIIQGFFDILIMLKDLKKPDVTKEKF